MVTIRWFSALVCLSKFFVMSLTKEEEKSLARRYKNWDCSLKNINHKRGNYNFTSGKIYKGSNARIRDIPWQISLQIVRTSPDDQNRLAVMHVCGGSIIGEDTVVTAEHCHPKYQEIPYTDWRLLVVAGVSDFRDHKNAQTLYVLKWIGHKDYSEAPGDQLRNDIALIKTDGSFVFTDNVQKIAVSTSHRDLWKVVEDCKTSGWGEFSGYSLDWVDSHILSDDCCRLTTTEAYLRELREPNALEDFSKMNGINVFYISYQPDKKLGSYLIDIFERVLLNILEADSLFKALQSIKSIIIGP